MRKFVIKRTFEKKGKTVTKSPKIQRLVTPLTLQRKRHRAALKVKQMKKVRAEEAAYQKLYAQRMKEQRERRASLVSKRRSRNSKRLSKTQA